MPLRLSQCLPGVHAGRLNPVACAISSRLPISQTALPCKRLFVSSPSQSNRRQNRDRPARSRCFRLAITWQRRWATSKAAARAIDEARRTLIDWPSAWLLETMSASEETAQPDQLPPDPLASIITQVSANAPVPVRRAPPPRKRPQKAKTPKPVPAGPDPVSPPLTPAANAAEKVTPESTTLDSPTLQPPSPFQAKPKSKTSPWHSLLSALGCFSSKHFDDAPEMQEKPNRGGLRRKLSSKRVGKQKEATPPLPNDAPVTSSKSALLVDDPTATVSAPPEPGPSAPANDRGTLGTQEATANSLRAGVILSKEETGNVLSGAVVPPGADGHTPQGTPRKRRSKASTRGGLADETESLSQEESSDQDVSEEEDDEDFLDDQDEEDRIIAAGGMGIPLGPDGKPQPLLTEIAEVDQDRKCLVLDLDETLVHSSFKMIHPADYVVPVEIENQSHNVYVIKRPGVDEFLRRMGELYEVVVFTASLSKYADPVLDQLDIHRVVRHRLFRESCYNHKGNYVKDLSQLGRPIGQTIIIDNSPASYIFHPRNALPVSSWFNDPHDTELTDMIGVLTDLATVEDVRSVLTSYLE